MIYTNVSDFCSADVSQTPFFYIFFYTTKGKRNEILNKCEKNSAHKNEQDIVNISFSSSIPTKWGLVM